MAEKTTQPTQTVGTAGTKPYKIKGIDFRFRGKTYRENSIVFLTDAELKTVNEKIVLELQETKKKEVPDGAGV